MYEFDVEKTKNSCVKWIRDFFENNGRGCNAVIGISGGKDSSVVAALCVEALGKDRVIGVLMPCGEQSDIDIAKLLVNHLGIKHYVVNIKDAVEAVRNSIQFPLSDMSKLNLPARIRMSTLYAVSQSCNGRVANTCNLSEDYVGYSTRYGDSVGDFSPCSNMTVEEVKAVGRLLGLPDVLVDKTPTDGLCGKTDEDNLGFTYAVLDKYIRTGEIDDPDAKEAIDLLHRKNLFKLQLMPSFMPESEPKTQADEIICFHSPDEENAYLSNWFYSDFTADGITFTSMEQYMMYHKACCFHDEDTAAKILATDDFAQIKALGRQVSGYNDSVWNGMRQLVVYEGLKAKFTQNPILRAKLKATGNAILAECAVGDKIWGIGLSMWDEDRLHPERWQGKNLLGYSLMAVREKI